MKGVGFVLALALVLPFVSAIDCWAEHDMPLQTWGYNAWLCVSGGNHGWIYSVGPTGHPSAGRMFKVNLDSFTYSSPYPATLTCYEQFTDIPPGLKILPQTSVASARTRGGSGPLNDVPQGPLLSWHYASTITLVDGNYTQSGTQWVNYGCPPIMHWGQAGSPPQAHIYVDWGGYGNRRSAAVAAPYYAAINAPYYGYLSDYVDVMSGQTSLFKAKRTRR